MKCNCTRLKFRVRESNLKSKKPTRRLIAKCMDCPRIYVFSANPREIKRLLEAHTKFDAGIVPGTNLAKLRSGSNRP